jgi:hypothetical protein
LQKVGLIQTFRNPRIGNGPETGQYSKDREKDKVEKGKMPSNLQLGIFCTGYPLPKPLRKSEQNRSMLWHLRGQIFWKYWILYRTNAA